MLRGQLPVEERLNKGPGEWTTEKRMATKGKKGHLKLHVAQRSSPLVTSLILSCRPQSRAGLLCFTSNIRPTSPNALGKRAKFDNQQFADLPSLHHSTASPRHCLELLVGPVETEAALGRSPDHPSHAKASTLNEEGSRDSCPPTNMTAGRQDVYCRQLI